MTLTKHSKPTLYFHPNLMNSQKVLIALFENDFPFVPVELNYFKGEFLSESFLKINPSGEIPVLKVSDEETYVTCEEILEYVHERRKRRPDLSGCTSCTICRETEKCLEILLNKLDCDALFLGCLHYFDEMGLTPEQPYVSKMFREKMRNMMFNRLPFTKHRMEALPEYKNSLLAQVKMLEKSVSTVMNRTKFNELLKKLTLIFCLCENLLKDRPDDSWLFSSKELLAIDINVGILLHNLFEMGLGGTTLWKRHPKIDDFYRKFSELKSFKQIIKLTNGTPLSRWKRFATGLLVFSVVFGLSFCSDLNSFALISSTSKTKFA